ncbi:MAG TPA: TonB-dependent receptor, partial [Caulobacteraceae bacterium]|nr:TonB-dependent receptor [Caulobacteraceae bacterium]
MYCPACGGGPLLEAVINESATHPRSFEPEFVDAFELGSKNTMWDGKLTLNLAAFYYDYRAYQISQIVNRSAINLNFDAEVWGIEIEADWRPLENLKLGFKGGYENTRVADGMSAVDVMDRTAGREGWLVVKPFPTFPSNCILPIYTVVYNGQVNVPGNVSGGEISGCELAYVLGEDPLPQGYPGYIGFDPSDFPDINNGEGFSKDLSGNQLPNAPEFTATITADYTIPLPNEWFATLHTDLYYQTEAWWRIFNTPGYDKLKAYTNINLAAIFTNEALGWKVMAYVKNVMDRDSITGAFLNSDDTGLTTNVFLTEPRLLGLRVTKDWKGGAWWTGADMGHAGPFPLTVEIGGQVQRHDAPYARLAPEFDGQFPAALDAQGTQNQDLDWGDGREVTLTWRPEGSPWTVAGGARFGKTNGAHELRESQLA